MEERDEAMKRTPQVDQALEMLWQAGFESYLVGGAVRDYVRGCEPAKDWDIATSARPEQIEAVFAAYRWIETGLKHGTVTVLIDGQPLEITTYRIDGQYSDNRRPDSVSFTGSLREDLARRDFTMNALAYHPRTGLVDCFGGVGDIGRKLIRCVGEPDKRFQEDGLRILRALRFAATFGMQIEDSAADAVRRNKGLLTGIAVERIRGELTGMLCGSEVASVLREYADVLSEPLPEITPMIGFEQHNEYHCHDVWHHTAAVVRAIAPEPVLRWAAFFHDMGKPACFTLDAQGIGHFYGHAEKSAAIADGVMKRLRFDYTSREQILFLVRHHDALIASTEQSAERAIRRFGTNRLKQLVKLSRADVCGQSARSAHRIDKYARWERMIDEIADRKEPFSRKDLAVVGQDMIALGYEGEQIGYALNMLVEAVVYGGLDNDKNVLLDYVRAARDTISTRER